jgi:tetratricopeptide (TPR) repeat protein
LQRAASLMDSAPDSSLRILQGISSSTIIFPADKAYYGLLMFQALDRNYQPLTPDTLIDYAIDYYHRYGPASRLALAYLYKARMYKYASHLEEASQLLFKAIENANENADFALLGRAYSDLGYISFILNDFQTARNKYKQAHRFFSKTNLNNHIKNCLLDIGKSYYSQKKYDSATIYYRQALLISKDSLAIGSCLQDIAENYYGMKKNDSALFYVRKILKYPYIDNNRAIRYSMLADVFFDLGQLDSARMYATEALQYKTDLYIRRDCYRILGNTAYLKKEMTVMAHYYGLYTGTSDSVKNFESQTKVPVLEKLNHYDKKLQVVNKHRMLLVISIMAIFIITFIFFYFYNKRNKRNAREQYEQILITREALAHNQEVLIHRQKALVSELKAKINIQRNAILHSRKKTSQAEKEAQLIEMYTDLLQIQDWKSFSNLMNQTFNDIVTTLQNITPPVKDSEIIWCCLHLLDIPQSERMLILNVSPDSLYKLKQRLARKLQLEGTKKLDDYLRRFYDPQNN